MALEDLRIQYRDLGNRVLGSVKLVLAFVCGLALLWEFGSTQYGVPISAGEKSIIGLLDYFIIAVFLGKNVLTPLLSRDAGSYLKRNFVEMLLSIILVLFILTSTERSYEYPLIGVKLFAMIVYPYRVLVTVLARVRTNTPLTVAFSFLAIIIIGLLLFMLPKSTVSGDMKAVDALFTATSATCVTGLIVVDTGRYFSPFGQAVLLCLIQVGGLGLMTFMAFFSMALGRGLGLKQEMLIKDTLSLEHRFGLRHVIVFILTMTFVVEAAGAFALYFTFPFPPGYSLGAKVWFSVFHSISAFCNSGFSLFSTSFMTARTHIPLNIVAAALIVIGGLGFVVNYNILSFLRARFRRKKRFTFASKETGLAKLGQFGVHTKVVIITTIILLAAGTFCVYLIEAPRNFGYDSSKVKLGPGEKLTASFFQSVTARTAGFNTVDIGPRFEKSESSPHNSDPELITKGLAPATQLLVIILMFIGASPGSTGGGIKTATFAMLVFVIIARLRNRNNIEVFKRTIPQRVISNGFVVVIVALSVVLISTMLLTITEEGANFISVLFEVVSAFGTVGLSTGITGSLSVAGKITIIVTMFVGRIGPLTLMLAMSRQEIAKRYEYPEEGIMIG